MADPVLHLIAGPDGAGKSTLYDRAVGPVTKVEFVNADVIAARESPDDAGNASRMAAERRDELLAARTSLVTETVFSHESKVDLVKAAAEAGCIVTLQVVPAPEDLAVARLANRLENDGGPRRSHSSTMRSMPSATSSARGARLRRVRLRVARRQTPNKHEEEPHGRRRAPRLQRTR